MERTITLFYKIKNCGIRRLWIVQGHIPTKRWNQPMLILWGLPFCKQSDHFLNSYLQDTHITEEKTGPCSRLAGISFMMQGYVCDRGLLNVLLPTNGICTTRLHRIQSLSSPINRLILANIVLTVWFFVQLFFPCLSRQHAKLSPSNSQSFPGICSLLQRRD